MNFYASTIILFSALLSGTILFPMEAPPSPFYINLLPPSLEKLFVALQNQNFDEVRTILNAGASPHAWDKNGKTTITIAVEACNLEIAKLLLEKGAHIDARNYDGTTPLMTAIMQGNCAMVRTLISLGADINQQDLKHRQGLLPHPLFIALEYRQFEIIRILLESGADTRVLDVNGKNLLHHITNHIDIYASWRDTKAVLSLLISHGTPLDEQIAKTLSAYKNKLRLADIEIALIQILATQFIKYENDWHYYYKKSALSRLQKTLHANTPFATFLKTSILNYAVAYGLVQTVTEFLQYIMYNSEGHEEDAMKMVAQARAIVSILLKRVIPNRPSSMEKRLQQIEELLMENELKLEKIVYQSELRLSVYRIQDTKITRLLKLLGTVSL